MWIPNKHIKDTLLLVTRVIKNQNYEIPLYILLENYHNNNKCPFKTKKITSVVKGMKKMQPLYMAIVNMKWPSYCGKEFNGFSKSKYLFLVYPLRKHSRRRNLVMSNDYHCTYITTCLPPSPAPQQPQKELPVPSTKRDTRLTACCAWVGKKGFRYYLWVAEAKRHFKSA